MRSIGTRTDVRHWVTIKNLAGYPAVIHCQGRIPSPYPLMRFDSIGTGDTETFWAYSAVHLPANSQFDLSHVILLAVGVSGQEIILTDVEVF
jgi:hypothetical protein